MVGASSGSSARAEVRTATERDPRGRKAIIPNLLKAYQGLLEGMNFAEAARFMEWTTLEGQTYRLTRAALSLYFKTHPEALDGTGLLPKSWQRAVSTKRQSDTRQVTHEDEAQPSSPTRSETRTPDLSAEFKALDPELLLVEKVLLRYAINPPASYSWTTEKPLVEKFLRLPGVLSLIDRNFPGGAADIKSRLRKGKSLSNETLRDLGEVARLFSVDRLADLDGDQDNFDSYRAGVRVVIQPPSINLITVTETRINEVNIKPIPLIVSFLLQWSSLTRSLHQWRTIPSWEIEKVINTLML